MPHYLNATRNAVFAGDGSRRPAIEFGSRCHFFEVNPALAFDRPERGNAAPAGAAVHSEAGQTRDVRLIPLWGKREVYGSQGAPQILE